MGSKQSNARTRRTLQSPRHWYSTNIFIGISMGLKSSTSNLTERLRITKMMYDLNAFRLPVSDSEHATNHIKISRTKIFRMHFAKAIRCDLRTGIIELAFSGSYRTMVRGAKKTRD